MAESVLTASYRATNVSESEKQAIIDAAVAAVDSTKPKYKQIAVNVTNTENIKHDVSYSKEFSIPHGMKTIQTATFIATANIIIGGSSGNTPSHESGWEIPISTTGTPLGNYTFSSFSIAANIKYTSSNVIVVITAYYGSNSGSHGQYCYINGIAKFYGTY